MSCRPTRLADAGSATASSAAFLHHHSVGVMMRIWCIVVVLSVLGLKPVEAAITSAESDRLRDAAAVLRSLRTIPDNDIPEDVWARSACVVVIPSVRKAAFIFGGEYGKGVMTCKAGQTWTAPAFMQLEKGSWGFQIGAEEIDLVLLVMNRHGVDKLLQDKVSLSAGASVAAGPVGRTATASTDLQLSAEILSYSRTQGLFAGLNLSGGVLGPDNDANHDVYGPGMTARQILFDSAVKIPAAAAPFVTEIATEFRPTATSGRK
jgi:lipid-binding SYLF domain-containing protein